MRSFWPSSKRFNKCCLSPLTLNKQELVWLTFFLRILLYVHLPILMSSSWQFGCMSDDVYMSDDAIYVRWCMSSGGRVYNVYNQPQTVCLYIFIWLYDYMSLLQAYLRQSIFNSTELFNFENILTQFSIW